jgi:flagellar capping protein FliD
MGGMASGIEVDQIIKKLVDVEARPLLKYQEEKELYGFKSRL